MKEIKFQVEGIDGDFFVDADALNDYRTVKAFALSEKNPAGFYEAMEKIYMGNDADYVERVGGMDHLADLNDAAAEAVKAKN
ncbi:MAG TPA: hypothetical protein OIM20_07680 [Eggerthellaceae bacterium]|nr:hypothetical protein [Eggerthellaceae bacterium]